MNAAIDHVFILCSMDGSEADALTHLGLKEGTPNAYPGQGTACRRFFFSNAYLELLWVSDPKEARAPDVLPTRLWERWATRGDGACPFGIVFRPVTDAVDNQPPFASWSYRPQYIPPGLSIEVAQDTPLAGPEFFYLGFQRDPARIGHEPVSHDLPIRSLAGVAVWRPAGGDSNAARSLQAAGLVTFHDADHYLLELRFDDASGGRADLRPTLPLVLGW